MLPNIGPLELLVVFVIGLLILGPKKLPSAGRALGSGMREFKDSLTGGSRDSATAQPDGVAGAEHESSKARSAG